MERSSSMKKSKDMDNNNYDELPLSTRDDGASNLGYVPHADESFVVTTPMTPPLSSPPAPESPTRRDSKPHENGGGTVSSIPDILAPEPPRSITTVNITDSTDNIRHSGAPTAQRTSSGFDPVPKPDPVPVPVQAPVPSQDPIPDSYSMPPMSNPLLQHDPSAVVFINGVATLPPPGTSWVDHPPPYSESAEKSRKKKSKKPKNKKHVLIDTQRNMVHTFKSTNSDVSASAFAAGQNGAVKDGKVRPKLGQVNGGKGDSSNVYDTIPDAT